MRYKEAVTVALTAPWFGYVTKDSICGNGAEIALYGIKLLLGYVALFAFRLAVALLFPLSAFLIIYISNKNQAYQELAKKQVDWLHR